ncbi:MAG: histidine kinase, partial [Bacteroidia bacterium]|nr:histidine kinase [Bacteroidia bacterium]
MYQDFKEKKYLDTIEMFMGGIRAHAVKLGPYNRLLEQYYRKKAFLSLKVKDLDNSLKFLDSAHNIVRVFPMRVELYSINGDKANIYRKKKQFDIAERYADSSLMHALNENVVSSVINAYDIVYMVARDAGKSDKALWAFENMTRINDSIIDVKNTGKIAELEQKYNKAQNEKTIRELNQEAEIKNLRIRVLAIGIALTILLIIVIIFFYRQSLIKNRQKVLETEQRLNRSRINPHFFFNAITTLQGIAVKENDGKKVALNLYKFSSLMRQTLESSYNDYVSIDTELEFIQKYIELQQLKENDKFSLETTICNDVETSDTLIPAMLIQPFLENSIEHGFGNIDYKGKIDLNFEIRNNDLCIVIKDNGAGLNKESQKPNKHISRAMQITKDRLYLLNKEKKSNASFSVNANEPNGVKIEIILPLIYK